MDVEIISIGDELLDGSVNEQNANFISKKLKKYNITPHHISIIGDEIFKITNLLYTAKDRSDIIIITGGLGPTGDDITRNAVAKAFDLNLIYREEITKRIEKRLEEYHVKLTDNNNQQAMIPEGAQILENKNGTAPGFIINKDETVCICMPGVPKEMKPMFKNQVLNYLNLKQVNITQNELYFKGIGEAQLEDTIYNSVDIPEDIHLSFVVKKSHILVKINGKDKKLVDNTTKKIKNKLGQNIFEDLNLIKTIYNMMKNNNLTLSTAESCSGGLLGNRLTNLAGSSSYYLGGIIAYSNQLKINVLNVDSNIIETRGAVSKRVASQMAENIKTITGSDYGIGITGIAGPSGGTKEKPVGLVYIAVANQNKTLVKKLNLKGKRKQIKYLSTEFALKNLKFLLKEKGDNHEK
ncbi:MAG: competence/damage-inducible protein A [Halanaerobiales bacterium]|nr:competence/damage-inducible protein A [Halanaerobiales bacterium]